ncbi:MAG TPA: hypothetical protein VGZ68_01105 [Acidimicrobiales bacterium]|jgi:hypothetical protein|nr:hypothetical protein [Acidimicrobiales bacterium]
MNLALKIAALVIVLLVLVVAALRFRKLRRDESRESSKPLERRLVAPPPSPYAPSKGFRLIDAEGEPLVRPPVERPRLDPERRYVFNDAPSGDEEFAASRVRHNDDWFLSRSSHRSTSSIVSRRLGLLILAVLIVAALIAYYADHNSKTPPSGTGSLTTTTLSPPAATTTTTPVVTFPTSFVATSVSGDVAIYHVPASKYRVLVTGSLGATWAVYAMGPSSTLEWQGTVAKGRTELLTMTGNSRITIGSPTNAAVSVDGRPVTFPTPRPATLILVFDAVRPTSTS